MVMTIRKIISKEEQKKKKRQNQLIIGLILIGVMVFGTLGYAFEGKEDEENLNKVEYNGLEFIKQNDYWITNIGGVEFIFKYNPTQVNKTEGNFNVLSEYSQKPMYISSENEIASFEIARNVQPFVQRIQKACLEEKYCQENLPIKTCKDNFIIIQESATKKIEQKENCVFIEGENEELVKLSDEFLFKMLGIN